MSERYSQTLERWHEFIKTLDASILSEILADDVKLHSPFVWKPKNGKQAAIAILTTVTEVFQEFSYVREIRSENQFCLEFAAKVSEFDLRGVDLIELDDNGKIIDFEVMIRPANALAALGAAMSKKLAEKGLL
ncbi:MAG: nuclear transport factor 2 family protein [Pyrinomonadaceae bacterium]